MLQWSTYFSQFQLAFRFSQHAICTPINYQIKVKPRSTRSYVEVTTVRHEVEKKKRSVHSFREYWINHREIRVYFYRKKKRWKGKWWTVSWREIERHALMSLKPHWDYSSYLNSSNLTLGCREFCNCVQYYKNERLCLLCLKVGEKKYIKLRLFKYSKVHQFCHYLPSFVRNRDWCSIDYKIKLYNYIII